MGRRKKDGFYKGKYIVENRQKYLGKTDPIYRSSWESKFCYFLDHTPQVKKWNYECIEIEYYNPIDKKIHRYFPDFYFEEEDNNNKKRTFIVEVKPKSQIRPPKAPKNNNGKARLRYLNEAKTYVINKCKWESADAYCRKKGYEFRIASLVRIKGNDIWKVVSLKQI